MAVTWFEIRRRVIHADTDAMGIVYYGNYLRFLEEGRVELLRSKGKPYREIEAMGYMMPVAEVGVRYRAPARYDDELVIATRVEELTHAQVRFAYEIRRADPQELLVTGFTRHACLDAKERRVRRIPQELAELLRPQP